MRCRREGQVPPVPLERTLLNLTLPACSDGKTPLQVAIDQKETDVVAYLRSIGAK